MDIVQRKLKDIKPYEKNPRKNDKAVEYVANSIRQFGFKVPIIIDKDGVIVAGHTRYKACKRLKMKEVPCVIADDLSDEEVKAFRLADNKVSEIAEWDMPQLDVELDGILDIDMADFGFELGELAEPEVIEDEYEEELPAEPKTRLGDLYKLGDHKLLCGDSTDTQAISILADDKVHMVYTDPPYGMDLDTDYSDMKSKLGTSFGDRGMHGSKYAQGKVDDFSPEMIDAIFAVGAEEVFIWGGNYFAELLPDRNNGSWVVWDKRANGNDDIAEDYSSDKMYGSCFELCWSKKAHKQDIARVKWAGVFGTEQEFDHKRVHPTQKPTKLASWFLSRYSKEGDTIVDLFGGSGSTLIACEQMGRQCYMAELDPAYCDVIIDRWEALTGNKAELLENIYE